MFRTYNCGTPRKKNVGEEVILAGWVKRVRNLGTVIIDVVVTKLRIIRYTKIPPFIIEEKTDGNEDIRMKYRYLDLRRDFIKKKLITRHKIVFEIRKYLSENGFLEIETPLLVKSTP